MKYGVLWLLLCTCLPASADIYKWTDEQGKVHYSDAKPAEDTDKRVPAVEKLELTPITIMENRTVKNESNDTLTLVEQMMQKMEKLAADAKLADPKTSNNTADVEIFTTPRCGYCKQAKSWLNSQGVSYKEYNVETDSAAALRMRSLGGGGGVPFAMIKGQAVRGFNPLAYQAALDQ
jgi:glutaredoxin